MRALPLFGDGRRSFLTFDAQPTRTLNPLKVDAPDVLAWIESKEPIPVGRWDEMGPEEYARSFTAARTAGVDVIDDLYFAFYDTIKAGGDERNFANLVTPILKQKGWLEGDDGRIANRVQLIYDTNLRLARSAGRWQRYLAAKSGLPYLRAVTARDERVRHPPKSPRSDHRAWDGIILPIEHWFWTVYFPPLGFRCRCDVIQMTRSQLARRADGITSEADLSDRIARLGEPVFASPAAPITAQLDQAVQATNAEAFPGRPNVDPAAELARGRALWTTTMNAAALEQFGEMLAKLFG